MKSRRAKQLVVLGTFLLMISISVFSMFQSLPVVRNQGPEPLKLLAPRTFTVAADAAILSGLPTRNLGGSPYLEVGYDVANSSVYRSLLKFDLSAIPSTARIINATLRLYLSSGPSGMEVTMHRVRASWIEGGGSEFAFKQNVTVTETAGVPRTREPVMIHIDVPSGLTLQAESDVKVFDSSQNEVPSQVLNITYTDGFVTGANVVFSSSNAPYESKRYDVYYGTLVPILPSYRAVTPWVERWNFTVPVRYASLSAADLDGDGKLEVVVASSTGVVYALRYNGTLWWSYNVGAAIENQPMIDDVNGDGKLEVLFATYTPSNHRVYALSNTGSLLWNTGGDPGKEIEGPFALADLNGDRIKEIYANSQDRKFYAFNGSNGALLWTYGLLPAYGLGVAIGNFTDGPEQEIVFATLDGKMWALNKTGGLLWTKITGANSFRVTPSIADIDSDGTNEIVAGDADNSGKQFALAGNSTTLWQVSTSASQYGGQVIVDFNKDGCKETVFVRSNANGISALDCRGAWLWNFTTGDAVYSVPAAADVDLDGQEEIIFGSFDGKLYVVNSTGQPEKTITTGIQIRATPVIADLDADGNMEIVFATGAAAGDKVYAYTTNSLGHDWRVGSYNLRNTGNILDGNSPDGASFLSASMDARIPPGGPGVTWNTRDGTLAWAAGGSDYEPTSYSTAFAPSSPGWMSWNATQLVQEWVQGLWPQEGFLMKAQLEGTNIRSIFVSKEGNPLYAPVLEIDYVDDPRPMIVGVVPDQIKMEDDAPWSLNLIGYASDSDTSLTELKWNLLGMDKNLYTLSGGNVTGNHVLTFTLKPNAYGNDLVTLLLTDDMGYYDTQPLWINVTAVNDPPVFASPAIFYVHYDDPYNFDFSPYISDVDDSKSSLILSTDDPAHVTITGLQATFLYPQSMVNTWQFTVLSVSDGKADASELIAVKVTEDYPPKLIRPLPDITMEEGKTLHDVFDLDDYFMDQDGDVLFFSYGYTHLNVTIKANHSVDIQALGEWYGNETVTFRATDPTGAIIEDTILVIVSPINDPPTIDPLTAFVVHYNVPYTFDLLPYIHDRDSELSELWIMTSDPDHVTVVGTILTMNYPAVLSGQSWPYTVYLTIYVTDGIDTAVRIVSVTVTDDYPPVLASKLPDVAYAEDTSKLDAFNLDAYFGDPDDKTIYYTSGNVNVIITIKSNHSVDFAAEKDWNGVELVTFRATDGRGAYAEDYIYATVTPTNDPPFIREIPLQEKRERNWVLDLTAYIGDVDNNLSDLKVATDKPYVTAVGLALIFNYEGYSDIYDDSVNITVSDGQASSSTVVSVRILRPDLLPMILPWIVAALFVVSFFTLTRYLRTSIEEVFLIYGNGLPIAHLSRTLTQEKDADLVASMFTAIQDFARESFKSWGSGELGSLQLGEYRVSIARGKNVSLAVLYRGWTSSFVDKKGKRVVEAIELRFRRELEDWSGNMSEVEGIRQYLESFYRAKATKVLLDRVKKPTEQAAKQSTQISDPPAK